VIQVLPPGDLTDDVRKDRLPAEEPYWLKLPKVDHAYGHLCFGQADLTFPFSIARVFYVWDIPGNAIRGGHANKACKQGVFCLRGAFTLWLFSVDGRSFRFRLEDPHLGVYVPQYWWVELGEYDPGTITLVVASTIFQESDYIRDPEDFFCDRPLPHPVSRPRG
jgi:hypothetical protein